MYVSFIAWSDERELEKIKKFLEGFILVSGGWLPDRSRYPLVQQRKLSKNSEGGVKILSFLLSRKKLFYNLV